MSVRDVLRENLGLNGNGHPLADDEPLVPMSVRELIQRFPELRPPVIHGMLRQGETMNVIASPKTGKSWLVTDLAIALATGRSWLGTFQTVPGRVLIIDNELHGETSANRIPKVAAARGVTTAEYADNVDVINLRGKLKDLVTLGKFFASLNPGQYVAIILDAFYRFLPRDTDENDNGAIAGLYNLLDNYADSLRSCFILIHHASKGQQGLKATTDVGAGAGSQSRATDNHVVIREHAEDGIVVLDAAVRSWAPLQPLCLRYTFPVFDPVHGLNPKALKGVKLPRAETGGGDDEPDDETPPVVWTADTFAARFITAEPQTRDQIFCLAEAEPGLSNRKAKQLLNVCISTRKAHVWTFGGKAVKEKIATIEQPVTATEGS